MYSKEPFYIFQYKQLQWAQDVLKKTKTCGFWTDISKGWSFILIKSKLHQWKQHKRVKTSQYYAVRVSKYILSYNWTLWFSIAVARSYTEQNPISMPGQHTAKLIAYFPWAVNEKQSITHSNERTDACTHTHTHTHTHTPHSTAEEDLLHLPARIAFGSSFSNKTLFPL